MKAKNSVAEDFQAKDVCECLDLGNPSQAVARLEDDERCLISNESLRVNGDAVVTPQWLWKPTTDSITLKQQQKTRLTNHESRFFVTVVKIDDGVA